VLHTPVARWHESSHLSPCQCCHLETRPTSFSSPVMCPIVAGGTCTHVSCRAGASGSSGASASGGVQGYLSGSMVKLTGGAPEAWTHAEVS
jgi:hypothetical protein